MIQNNFFRKVFSLSTLILCTQLHSQITFTGGSVSGGSISGPVNANSTTFNNVNIQGTGNFNNCTLNGCTVGSSEGAKPNPANAQSQTATTATTTTATTNTATDQTSPNPTTKSGTQIDPTANAASQNTTQASTTTNNSHTASTGAVMGKKSGVLFPNENARKDVEVIQNQNAEQGTHQAFVTRPDAESLRTPKSEMVRQQNFRNQLNVRETLKNDQYTTASKINLSDLKPRAELDASRPSAAERLGLGKVSQTSVADWEMGFLQQKEGGVLYDRWGNRVGISMYDDKYYRESGNKYSGNSFIHFDQDYKIGGTVIVPAGYYKNVNSGFIYDSSGTKVGEMLSSGEIRWPEFKVDIDPNKFKESYADVKHDALD